jgi:hypothetical protein
VALEQWVFLPSTLRGTTAGTGLIFWPGGTAGHWRQWALSPSMRHFCWHWPQSSAQRS